MISESLDKSETLHTPGDIVQEVYITSLDDESTTQQPSENNCHYTTPSVTMLTNYYHHQPLEQDCTCPTPTTISNVENNNDSTIMHHREHSPSLNHPQHYSHNVAPVNNNCNNNICVDNNQSVGSNNTNSTTNCQSNNNNNMKKETTQIPTISPQTITTIPNTGFPPATTTNTPYGLNSPAQIIAAMKISGQRKAELTFDQTILLSLFAGFFVGIGGVFCLMTGGNVAGLEQENPGLQKLLFAIVFPIGIVLVVLLGAELFTGNTLVVLVGMFARKWVSKKQFAIDFFHFSKNLFISYICNMFGAFLIGYLFVYVAQGNSNAHWVTFVKNIAVAKVSKTFGQLVLLGVICNCLVTLSIIMTMASNTAEGKVILAWIPITCFAASGYEHCIANSFFIPLGILYGAEVSIKQYLIDNLLPVTIGNMIGGSLVIGCSLYYVYDVRLNNSTFLSSSVKKIWNYLKQCVNGNNESNNHSNENRPACSDETDTTDQTNQLQVCVDVPIELVEMDSRKEQ